LKKVRKYAGPGHTVTEGELGGKLVALIVGGMGRDAARRAAELLIEGHQPRWVVSAGFAGALDPALKRLDIILPDEILDLEGQRLGVDLDTTGEPPGGLTGTRRGLLLTVDAIVRTAAEKESLRARFGADVVDMETSAVAEAARARGIRFASVRVVSDEAGIDLPKEIASLITKSGSYRVGAALRAIWNRPSSLKDFWTLNEHAHEAADRLADVTQTLIAGLPR
jgi:adenosylhomocysteine nucleosidase